jgi:ribose transport system ATP-binding protein
VRTEVDSTGDELLRLRGLTKRFPGVVALDSVEFDLRRGEVHALLGENGAGKSTLVKCVTGAHVPDDGTIEIEGEPFEFRDAADSSAAGIAAVYQELALVPQLSVARNILLGREPLARPFLGRLLRIVDRRGLEQQAGNALATFGLAEYADRPAGSLGIARGQLIEIARAVCSSARILLLDEPTSSLTATERDQLFENLRRLAATGVGIIYISHRLDEVIAIADRCTVLRDGKRVGTLAGAEMTADRMVELMTGRGLGLAPETEPSPVESERVVLEVRGLSRRPAFEDVSFKVHAGEIVGLAGLVGAGRTEVMRAIFGADPTDAGEVLVEGKAAQISGTADAIEAGIALVTEDRHTTGILPLASVAANIGIAALNAASAPTRIRRRAGLFSPQALLKLASTSINQLGIRARSPRQEMRYLSGGNQQKAIIARWLAVRPQVLLLDDPTRGIAIRSKHEIHELVRTLAQEGAAIVLVSSELPELLALANRILVLRKGQIVAELESHQASESRILRHASVG